MCFSPNCLKHSLYVVFFITSSVICAQNSSIQLEYTISGFGKYYVKGIVHYQGRDVIFFVKDELSDKDRFEIDSIGIKLPDFRNLPLTQEDIDAGRSAGSAKIVIDKVPKKGELGELMQANLNEGYRLSKKYYKDLDKTYFLKENINAIDWNIHPDTKVIGKFQCQKATGSFGGRSYIVWFTSEIPLPVSFWKLDGLPGAIVEGTEDSKRIEFSLNEIRYDAPLPLITKWTPNLKEIINCDEHFRLNKENDQVIVNRFRRIATSLPRNVKMTVGEIENNAIQLNCN